MDCEGTIPMSSRYVLRVKEIEIHIVCETMCEFELVSFFHLKFPFHVH